MKMTELQFNCAPGAPGRAVATSSRDAIQTEDGDALGS